MRWKVRGLNIDPGLSGGGGARTMGGSRSLKHPTKKKMGDTRKAAASDPKLDAAYDRLKKSLSNSDTKFSKLIANNMFKASRLKPSSIKDPKKPTTKIEKETGKAFKKYGKGSDQRDYSAKAMGPHGSGGRPTFVLPGRSSGGGKEHGKPEPWRNKVNKLLKKTAERAARPRRMGKVEKAAAGAALAGTIYAAVTKEDKKSKKKKPNKK